MILVTGAMGRIGTAAVATLQRGGHRVRALVPSRRQVPWLLDRAHEFVEAEGDVPEDIEAAVDGVSGVILIARPSVEHVAMQRRMIDACAQAGIARVVKLSVAGAAEHATSEAARWHWLAEQQLRDRVAMPTVLRVGRTMQDLLAQTTLIRAHRMLVGCQGDGATADVDARDVGEVLAALAVAADAEAHRGGPLLATGPAALTRHDVALELGRALGVPLRYVACSPLELEQVLESAGVCRWQVDDLVAYESAAADGEWLTISDTVERITGHAPRTFAGFANEFAHAMQYHLPPHASREHEGHSRMTVPSPA